MIFAEVDNIEDLLPYGYDPNKTENEMQHSGFDPVHVLANLRPNLRLSVPPKDVKLAWSSLTSLLVVRHPLDRLVSLYNNKFIGGVRGNDEEWIRMTNLIIEKYRVKSEDGYEDIITPQEMVRWERE